MKLSEMIEETLSEIAIGVKNAKEKSRGVLAISPGTMDGKVVAEITYIEFDVSVAVAEAAEGTSSTEKGVGGELRVMSIGLGAKANAATGEKSSASSHTTHRITFKVPICMGAEMTFQD